MTAVTKLILTGAQLTCIIHHTEYTSGTTTTVFYNQIPTQVSHYQNQSGM